MHSVNALPTEQVIDAGLEQAYSVYITGRGPVQVNDSTVSQIRLSESLYSLTRTRRERSADYKVMKMNVSHVFLDG